MRWLKHLSQAHKDEKLSQFLERFGLEGYGLWWLLLEHIAITVEPGRESCTVVHTEQDWAMILHVDARVLRSCCDSLTQLGLITVATQTQKVRKNRHYTDRVFTSISVPNILKYRDEYSRKSGLKSGVRPDTNRDHGPDNVAPDRDREQSSILPAVTLESRVGQKPSPNGAQNHTPESETVWAWEDDFGALFKRWRKPGPRPLAEQYFCEEISRGVSVEIITAGLQKWVAYYDASGKWPYCQQSLAAAIHDRSWQVEPPPLPGKIHPVGSIEQQRLNADDWPEYVSADDWARLHPDEAAAIEREGK